MDKDKELPEPLQEEINSFFSLYVYGKDFNRNVDGITQGALRTIDINGTQDAGDVFSFMWGVKDLIAALKPYAR